MRCILIVLFLLFFSCKENPKFQEDLKLSILNENIKVNPATYSPYGKLLRDKNVVIKYKIENKSNHTYLLLNDWDQNGGISWLREISFYDLIITDQNNIEPKFGPYYI